MAQVVVTPPAAADTSESSGAMSHRQIMEALSGLLLAMFVAMLSSTVVTNALPRIVSDLHGTQTGYTWVVVATLLAMTATTPIWGKLADLFNKKVLVQVALLIYVAGSLIASISPNMGTLIGARVVQGVGVGGLSALVQVVIAAMVPPRERGRYSGYLGAVFALATISGPLIGGVVADSPLGWRGCFYVGIPVAILALVVLQAKLHLPVVRREVEIDYLGATLIVGGVSILLLWVSLAGTDFAWLSATTAVMLVGGIAIIVAALLVEARVATEPIIPLHLLRDRTTALATLASVFVGVAMFAATVFMSEYFQNARGMTPTKAGLMSVPMVVGLMIASLTSGRIISATGRWKAWLVGGLTAVVVGLGLLSTIDSTTSLLAVGTFLAVLGMGIGCSMQNLVLAVQNNTAPEDMGAASSVVAFARSMGGAAGVSALGALLGSHVSTQVMAGLARLGITASTGNGDIPDLAALPAPIRALYETAFGDATGRVFLVAAPFALVALVLTLFIKEVPLRTSIQTADPVVEAELDPQVRAELAPAGVR